MMTSLSADDHNRRQKSRHFSGLCIYTHLSKVKRDGQIRQTVGYEGGFCRIVPPIYRRPFVCLRRDRPGLSHYLRSTRSSFCIMYTIQPTPYILCILYI